MATLAVLRHDEGIRVDAERLVAIYAGRGKREAEDILQRGIAALSARMTDIRRQFEADDGPAMVQSLRLACRIAGTLGMPSFIAVAGDLIRATEAADCAARAATLARLMRIADRSVTAIRDLRDMTV